MKCGVSSMAANHLQHELFYRYVTAYLPRTCTRSPRYLHFIPVSMAFRSLYYTDGNLITDVLYVVNTSWFTTIYYKTDTDLFLYQSFPCSPVDLTDLLQSSSSPVALAWRICSCTNSWDLQIDHLLGYLSYWYKVYCEDHIFCRE